MYNEAKREVEAFKIPSLQEHTLLTDGSDSSEIVSKPLPSKLPLSLQIDRLGLHATRVQIDTLIDDIKDKDREIMELTSTLLAMKMQNETVLTQARSPIEETKPIEELEGEHMAEPMKLVAEKLVELEGEVMRQRQKIWELEQSQSVSQRDIIPAPLASLTNLDSRLELLSTNPILLKGIIIVQAAVRGNCKILYFPRVHSST